MEPNQIQQEFKTATLGEQRCHIMFNPSNDDVIGQVKRKCVDLIAIK